jgi:ABC-2 type transport system permease protein
MAVPTILLFLGAVLAGLDRSDQVTALLKALVLQVLLATLVAGCVLGIVARFRKVGSA